MPCSRRGNISEKNINAVIDNILKKNSCGDRNVRKPREKTRNIYQNVSRSCQIEETEAFNNGIENSTRFSIRVMEAMRFLQRRSQDRSLTSNIMDIAKYIETNYRFDGDLEAQVRTVLSRISRQGLIMKVGKEDYHLVGPFASYMNKAESLQISRPSRPFKRKNRSRSKSRSRGSRSCGRCSRKRKDDRGRPKNGGKKGRPSTKVIRDPGFKKKGGGSSKNKDRPNSGKSKNLNKKKCIPLSSQCKCGCLRKHSKKPKNHKNKKQKHKEAYRPESSTDSFITCCEELSSENSIIGKKRFKCGLNFREGQCGSSFKINESVTSSSDKEGSEDSVYQELKTKNSNASGDNNKDLKRWIRNCRRECTHH